MYNSVAYRESCRRFPETCPSVDRTMNGLAEDVKNLTEQDISDLVYDATKNIKKVTNGFREALVEAVEEITTLEEKVKDLNAEITDLNSVVSDLEGEINSLRIALQEAEAAST